MKRIFFDYGIEICEEDSKYYFMFDDGKIVSHFTNIEISKSDTDKAMRSSYNAGEGILHYQLIAERDR